MFRRTAALAIAACVLAVRAAGAQCLLANPSFEVLGGSNPVFSGWNQFGTIARVTTAAHGGSALRVTGPNTGGWDVSGVWQAMDCAPGKKWNVSVCVSPLSAAPLAGGALALVNVEWRDGSGNLISYESHTVANPATPADAWRVVSFQSGAAPANTASIHLLVGVLQGPTDPVPQVLFDEVTCALVGPPTLDSLQWTDFSTMRTLTFSGRTWRVKGPGYLGPGPNLFDYSSSATWVDANGRLHLTIRKVGSNWYSSEVALIDALGYGDYVFTTRGRLDTLDPNAVFGLFLWEYGPCWDNALLWWNPFNEIDVEFSRWGVAGSADMQYVAQPAGGGNTHRFNATFSTDEVTTHRMRWLPNRVEWKSWRGGPADEATSAVIGSWTYTGAHIPRPEQPRVHLNLWQLAAPATTQEVVLDAFNFTPACPGGNCGVLAVAPPEPEAARLAAPAPNPFVAGTMVRFTMATAGRAELDVLDVAGRRVRRLAAGEWPAGEHALAWDGRDDEGRHVAPGVYLAALRAPGVAATRRLVVLK